MNLIWQFSEHLLAFLAAICLLVSVHEFGHYWVARKLGFKVLRFQVGFGKPVWSRAAGADRTEYSIGPIPIGGFVKLLDERAEPVAPEELSRSFTHRPHWQRIAVLLAGPAFNIAFAIVVLTGIFMASGVNDVRAVVGDVDASSIMGRAGVRSGDEIVAVDGQPARGQRDVSLGLFDAVSGHSSIALGLRGRDDALRTVVIELPDAALRRRLTEPTGLMSGLGLNFYEPPTPPVLGVVEADGPAAHAGLRAGDRIVAINASPVNDFRDLVTLIQSHPGQSVSLRYERAGAAYTTQIAVLSATQDGHTIGRIMVGQVQQPYPPSMVRHSDLSLPGALARASSEAWDMTALQGRVLWRMVLGEVSVKNLSGPLGIAQYAGDSASAGPSAFLGFLVLVSLALGFINLMPIPILDGGQIVFQAIEWLKGSPLSERFQSITQQLGIALLVLLMGVTLFNDIARQFG